MALLKDIGLVANVCTQTYDIDFVETKKSKRREKNKEQNTQEHIIYMENHKKSHKKTTVKDNCTSIIISLKLLLIITLRAQLGY